MLRSVVPKARVIIFAIDANVVRSRYVSGIAVAEANAEGNEAFWQVDRASSDRSKMRENVR